MSALQLHALDAIASQVVDALEKYGTDAERMMAAWPDLELYREVSDQIEGIRLYSGALPEARVQWVELLIAHAELIHFLWRLQYGDREAALGQIGPVRDRHADAVAALRRRCMRLASRSRQNVAG
ncbi:MAG: hypothetical protein EOO30_15000 [Comamonadaceae bacterium]|nr:MAG: hypothetical protein EOO30_15000 [Comamonadaceae bacterium]